MKKVIIDKKFFNLNTQLSTGLITGLKKLTDYGLAVEVEDFNILSDKTLNKILSLENINLNPAADTSALFYITSQKTKKQNSIYVNAGSKVDSFEKAVNIVLTKLRMSVQQRKTNETDIRIELSLDGKGITKINTGIGFFDHMLEQVAKHASINLNISVNGDLHVDEHHTVEDVGITLGTALNEALGDKRGIKRYGFFLPMDDAAAKVAIDLGGRAHLNYKVKFNREKVGEFPTELTEEFFRGLAAGLKANIYVRAKAKNDHHKIEAIFKAFAKSLNEACRLDERNMHTLPSTKGVL